MEHPGRAEDPATGLAPPPGRRVPAPAVATEAATPAATQGLEFQGACLAGWAFMSPVCQTYTRPGTRGCRLPSGL